MLHKERSQWKVKERAGSLRTEREKRDLTPFSSNGERWGELVSNPADMRAVNQMRNVFWTGWESLEALVEALDEALVQSGRIGEQRKASIVFVYKICAYKFVQQIQTESEQNSNRIKRGSRRGNAAEWKERGSRRTAEPAHENACFQMNFQSWKTPVQIKRSHFAVRISSKSSYNQADWSGNFKFKVIALWRSLGSSTVTSLRTRIDATGKRVDSERILLSELQEKTQKVLQKE